MENSKWHKGYKEVKNVIHNDVGATKVEILEVFRQVAKDEIQELVLNNKAFILSCIRDVIRQEMVKAVESNDYPDVRGNIQDYRKKNEFRNFITGLSDNKDTRDISYHSFRC